MLLSKEIEYCSALMIQHDDHQHQQKAIFSLTSTKNIFKIKMQWHCNLGPVRLNITEM